MQAVKDLLEELISESLVEKEKIGAGNYYWSFPITAKLKQKQAASRSVEQTEKLEANIEGT